MTVKNKILTMHGRLIGGAANGTKRAAPFCLEELEPLLPALFARFPGLWAWLERDGGGLRVDPHDLERFCCQWLPRPANGGGWDLRAAEIPQPAGLHVAALCYGLQLAIMQRWLDAGQPFPEGYEQWAALAVQDWSAGRLLAMADSLKAWVAGEADPRRCWLPQLRACPDCRPDCPAPISDQDRRAEPTGLRLDWRRSLALLGLGAEALAFDQESAVLEAARADWDSSYRQLLAEVGPPGRLALFQQWVEAARPRWQAGEVYNLLTQAWGGGMAANGG